MSFGASTAFIRPGATINAALVGPRGDKGQDGNSITGPAAWAPLAAWHPLQSYVIGPPASLVTIGGSTYVCVIAHTSTTFAADFASGLWATIASIGLTGQPGSMWYEGAGVPAATTGVTGDYWFQIDTADIFRKTDAGWGQPVANIKGLKGDTGPAGRTLLSGTGTPANTLGQDGDFYLDLTTTAPRLFGPKASGAWPASGISLIAGSGTVNPSGPFAVGHLIVAGTTDGKTIQDGGAPGDAAFKNTGKAAGMLAAGDDSRFADILTRGQILALTL